MRTFIGIILALACIFSLFVSIYSADAAENKLISVIFSLSAVFIFYSCYVLAFSGKEFSGIDRFLFSRVMLVAFLSGIYCGTAFSAQVPRFLRDGGDLGKYTVPEAHLILLGTGFFFGFVSIFVFYYFFMVSRKLMK